MIGKGIGNYAVAGLNINLTLFLLFFVLVIFLAVEILRKRASIFQPLLKCPLESLSLILTTSYLHIEVLGVSGL